MDMETAVSNFQTSILRIRAALDGLEFDPHEWPYAEDAITQAMEHLADAADALGNADYEGDEPNE